MAGSETAKRTAIAQPAATGAVAPAPRRQAASPATDRPGALILSGDCGALAIARSLGRQGIPVGFLPAGNRLASYSRYVSWSEPWPGGESPDAAAWLIALAERRQLHGWVLFPAGDSDVRLVAQNHQLLSQYYRLSTPAWEQTQWAADKHLTYRRAGELGIDHPRTYTVASAAEAARLECRFPLILKPAEKQGLNALTRAKAWPVPDRDALVRLFRQGETLAGPAGLIVQELIPGDDLNQFSYAAVCRDGRPLVSMAARRTRQSPSGLGTGTFVETLDEQRFDAAAERFLASIAYTGMVEMEFKLDPRDGGFKLLDVNPRVWTWNALGALAGADFAVAMWNLCLNLPVTEARARPGVSWLHVSRDLAEMLKQVVHGHAPPPAYVGSLLRASGFATFASDDPLPALADIPLGIMRRAGFARRL